MDDKRIINDYDISIMAYFTNPHGDAVCFDYYPTNDELESILVDTVQCVLDVNQETAILLITTTSTPERWFTLLEENIDAFNLEKYAPLHQLWSDAESN